MVLSWNDVVNGDVVYEVGRDGCLFGPFVVKDVDRQILINPKNRLIQHREFRCVQLKHFIKPKYEPYDEDMED